MGEKISLDGVLESAASFSLALGFFLCVLELLDLISPRYFFVYHKEIFITNYNNGFQLSSALLILLIPLLINFLREYSENKKHLLVFLPPLVALPIFGIRASILILFVSLLSFSFYKDGLSSQIIRNWMYILLAFFSLVFLDYVLVPFGLWSPLGLFSGVEFSVHFLFVPLVPLIICLGLFTWILRPLVDQLELKLSVPQDLGVSSVRDSLLTPQTLVIFSLIIGFQASLIPYLPGVNPGFELVGADIDTFLSEYEWVREDVWRAFQIREGSRPLFYLLLYGFQGLTGFSALNSVRFLPSLLYPLLVLATYFLAVSFFEDDWIGGYAAFFTATGVQVTIATYSYYQTNMLGLIFQYTSLGLFFRFIKNRKPLYLVLSLVLGGFTVFTHPWTFVQFIAVFLVLWASTFLKFPLLSKFSFESGIRYLSVYLFFLGFVELFKSLVLQDVGGSSVSVSLLESFSFNPVSWIPSLIGMTVLYDGMISNYLLFGLSAVGLWGFKPESDGEKYLWVLLILSSLIFLISDEILKSRILFNLPYGVFSAVGLKRLMGHRQFEGNKTIFLTLVIIMQLVYLLRSLVHTL